MLSDKVLGPLARGAGTTSNILYFYGDKLWTACSGDSRAVLGRWVGGGKVKGKVKSFDLSRDHKPDLPDEQQRIERSGGVVSKARAAPARRRPRPRPHAPPHAFSCRCHARTTGRVLVPTPTRIDALRDVLVRRPCSGCGRRGLGGYRRLACG